MYEQIHSLRGRKTINIILTITKEIQLLSRTQFYKKVVSALYFQMETIPADFMVDIVSSSNIVLHCLNEFFRNMYESDGISVEVILEGTLIRQKKIFESKFIRHLKMTHLI